MSTFTERVQADADDATERSDSTNFDSTRTEFVGRSGAAGNPYWYSGQRFSNVTIPKGATISSAKITITSSATKTISAITNVMHGNAADSAADFATDPHVVSRSLTSASVSWSMPTDYTTGVTYDSPDISSIIQELVNRAGWASGNAIMILNEPTSATAGQDVQYYTHELDSTKAVVLTVTYSGSSSNQTLALLGVGS